MKGGKKGGRGDYMLSLPVMANSTLKPKEKKEKQKREADERRRMESGIDVSWGRRHELWLGIEGS